MHEEMGGRADGGTEIMTHQEIFSFTAGKLSLEGFEWNKKKSRSAM